MNWLSLLPLILQIVQEAPTIIAAWNTAPTNAVAKVQAVVQKSTLLPTLEQIGSQLFPKLSPEIHAAAAALVVAHPNNTSWVQEALNLVQSTGYVNFGAPLSVDGVWGPKTRAAVEALQTKLGLPVNGFIADAEYNALSTLLTKIS